MKEELNMRLSMRWLLCCILLILVLACGGTAVQPTGMVPTAQPSQASQSNASATTVWKLVARSLWLDQQAVQVLAERGLAGYTPGSRQGWQAFAIDIIVENASGAWAPFETMSGQLLDAGGYSRSSSIYFGNVQANSIVVPPGFRFLATAFGELPSNQLPSSIAVQIGSQAESLDLGNVRQDFQEALDESKTSGLIQNTPLNLGIPDTLNLTVTSIHLTPRLLQQDTAISVPILNLSLKNTGGYDLSAQDVASVLRVMAIDQNGYWTAGRSSPSYDEAPSIFNGETSVAPGMAKDGTLTLSPFTGMSEYAYVVVGVGKEGQIAWSLLKVDAVTISQIWQSIKVAKISEVDSQLNQDGGTDKLSFELTLSSAAAESHEIEVTVQWERTEGSPTTASCPPGYRDTKVTTETETSNVTVHPGETLTVPFKFDYSLGYCYLVTGIIKKAEITKIDGFARP